MLLKVNSLDWRNDRPGTFRRGLDYGTETALESDLVPYCAPIDILRGQPPIGSVSALRELFPMALEIQTREPTVEGRYVVWTPCAALSAREYCEPSIATWHGGKWHFYESVWGWIGPLPVVHGNDCLKEMRVIVATNADDALRQIEQEYDL